MRKFWIDCVIATGVVFLSMWGIVRLTNAAIFNAFDPIGQALADVELTDYVFSQLRPDPLVDTNIVIVNIGRLPRRDIARQIDIISQYKPKVIGFDAFLDCETGLRDTVNCPALKDTLGNRMLSAAIRRAGNVILVTKLLQRDTTLDAYEFDSLRQSDHVFREKAYAEAYANLDSEAAFQEDVKTCRSFNPAMPYRDGEVLAFGTAIAMAYDPATTKEFLARDNFSEIINYRGNVVDFFGTTNYPQMFFTLDVDDVLDENFVPEMINGKIVIFAFLGEYLGDPSWNDKFYTPLNKKLAGKANPDMFGGVVHANIVSMILNEDFVDEMAEWQEGVLAFIICLLNVALFSLVNSRLPLWYDGITKLVQLIELTLLGFMMVMVFALYEFKLNITITLAAVALVGDVFEIYMSVIKNLFFKIKAKFSITPKDEDVLIPENE